MKFKFNTKIILITISILLILALPPAIIIPILNAQKIPVQGVQKGWQIQELKSQISKKENFIFYFGTSTCGACKSLTTKIQKSKKLQKRLQDIKKKLNKEIFYWYYTDKNFRSVEKRTFQNKLNQELASDIRKLSSEKKIQKNKNQIIATPTVLFFKEGKAIDILGNWDETSPNSWDQCDQCVTKILDKIKTHYPNW